ncbi:MAG: glycosyltransferase family 4 protein [Legionellaceae bacterium]|nr:glycosyltransferase family 4 protein [Legionellaceae bacterium]
MKKKVCILASYAPSILNFRKELILELVKTCDVYIYVPLADDTIKEKIEALGVVACRHAPLSTGSLDPLGNIKYLYALFRQFRKIQPDVVLSYTVQPVIWGSFAAKLAGAKHITSMITGLGYAFTDLTSLKRKVIHHIICVLYKNAISCNHAVLFQNKDDKALFAEKGLISKTQSSIVNGSGVNLSHFYHVTSFPKKMTFLMIGRLLRDKGIYEYVAAAKKIKSEYRDVEFHLVGWIDHNPSSITTDELERWCAEGIINFLGRQEDVRDSLASASVFVLPSYREGTPRSVLEAMSMGRPIITTDAPGCRETVVDGKNGYLVPVRSVEQLAMYMKQFIDNPSLVQALGEQSRLLAQSKYDVHIVNRTILAALKLL